MKFKKVIATLITISIALTGCKKEEQKETASEEVIEITEESESSTNSVYYDENGNEVVDIFNHSGPLYDSEWNEIDPISLLPVEESSENTDTTMEENTTESISETTTTVDDNFEINEEESEINSIDIESNNAIDTSALKFRFPNMGVNNEDLVITVDNSIIRNSRVLVPLDSINRFIPKITAEYDDIREVIRILDGESEYTMHLNTNVIYKDGISKLNAEAKTTLIEGTETPLIPLKSIGSLFGISLEYIEENNEIIVNGG